jgi:alpha-1,6-mannosyl-glycoprotein beta-1,2-N-acetylglucosaminyltransferase
VEGILLIFSHDVWSPEINQVVASVDFCQVLQIFFPFSIQLYPQEFPGKDPRDCPRDISKKDALTLGCINAEYPDSFGHYREAKFSQTKHHWWWKLHFVWDRVRSLKDHTGMVLLIEEDHYLAPDFLHLLRLMSALKEEQYSECDVLSLGSYSHIGFSSKANKVEVKAWKSTEHNMGMALNRDAYQKLVRCTDDFCTYDDYNWDWSLQHLTVSCLATYWKVMVAQFLVPLVFTVLALVVARSFPSNHAAPQLRLGLGRYGDTRVPVALAPGAAPLSAALADAYEAQLAAQMGRLVNITGEAPGTLQVRVRDGSVPGS